MLVAAADQLTSRKQCVVDVDDAVYAEPLKRYYATVVKPES